MGRRSGRLAKILLLLLLVALSNCGVGVAEGGRSRTTRLLLLLLAYTSTPVCYSVVAWTSLLDYSATAGHTPFIIHGL